MLDFSEFINLCQCQIKPLLKLSSPADLEALHLKIRQCTLALKQLHPLPWAHWKEAQGINELWRLIEEEADSFLRVIDSYEISEEKNEIIIYEEKATKGYVLLDPVHFIKANFYSREDIFFYLLLGEMMLEDNFSIFQIYGVLIRVRDSLPTE